MRSGVFEQVHECLRIRAHGKVDSGTHARGRHGFDGVKRRGLALASSIFFRLSLCPSEIADKQSFSFFKTDTWSYRRTSPSVCRRTDC